MEVSSVHEKEAKEEENSTIYRKRRRKKEIKEKTRDLVIEVKLRFSFQI